MADRYKRADGFEEGENNKKNAGNDKNLTKVSICKGIQVRLQNNESLKKLELRFMPLSR